jgi:AhpD family alkylhydroperoxidase
MVTESFVENRTEQLERVAQLRKAAPRTMAAFGQLHKETTADGALAGKEKKLIALGIAIALRCTPCILVHLNDALHDGATREEITEAIGVAVLMAGGPAAMYGSDALAALDEFLAT